MEEFRSIRRIFLRELGIMRQHPIYGFCTVVFPIVVIVFFTSLMGGGQPVEMPVGVVDQDGTPTSRAIARQLDAFQTSHVAGRYANVNAAREAMQRNEIYAFLLIPKGTTSGAMTQGQPRISFYYSNVTLVAGSLLYRDLKTVGALGSAAVAAARLAAAGKTDRETRTFLQPIVLDMHATNNPWIDYNVYLSTSMVPGVIMVFIFLLTPYSIGTELKFHRSRQWVGMADGNMYAALVGKLLPQTLLFLAMMVAFSVYAFDVLEFPHPGGWTPILLLDALGVLACQGFGVLAFGLMPSLRMSMSVCSLWAVLSLSLCGATYPLFAMDGALQAVAQLFPLHHFYMLYQTSVLNGFPLADSWLPALALFLFAALPLAVVPNIRKAMLVYAYIP